MKSQIIESPLVYGLSTESKRSFWLFPNVDHIQYYMHFQSGPYTLQKWHFLE